MPNRQYYCWKLCLKFNCGCSEYTPTQHVCNANRGVQWYVCGFFLSLYIPLLRLFPFQKIQPCNNTYLSLSPV